MLRIETQQTLADLIDQLGVPPNWIMLHPAPGTATEQDVLDYHDHKNRLVELIDGVLVEKAMGFEESIIGAAISYLLTAYVRPRKLGVVAGSDGMVRYRERLVQMADVAFFSWDRFPDRKLPRDAISRVTPNLAVEVWSKSNTEAEMERKRIEYFDRGAELVWVVDHRDRSIRVFTDPETSTRLTDDQPIDGGTVLPGFQVAIREFFDDLPS